MRLSLGVAFGLLLASAFGVPESQPPPAVAQAAGSHETANLKVLKVFTAKDEEAIFRAYLVEWKGRDVIVEDNLARTDFIAGDKINVLVMKLPYPQGKESYGLLHFAIAPPWKR